MIAQIPDMMQYGAMGILAGAFITVLSLWYRTDKRSQTYAKHLETLMGKIAEGGMATDQLVEVVKTNTAAMTQANDALRTVAEHQDGIRQRMDKWKCPFRRGGQNHEGD